MKAKDLKNNQHLYIATEDNIVLDCIVIKKNKKAVMLKYEDLFGKTHTIRFSSVNPNLIFTSDIAALKFVTDNILSDSYGHNFKETFEKNLKNKETSKKKKQKCKNKKEKHFQCDFSDKECLRDDSYNECECTNNSCSHEEELDSYYEFQVDFGEDVSFEEFVENLKQLSDIAKKYYIPVVYSLETDGTPLNIYYVYDKEGNLDLISEHKKDAITYAKFLSSECDIDPTDEELDEIEKEEKEGKEENVEYCSCESAKNSCPSNIYDIKSEIDFLVREIDKLLKSKK